jgi:hypothetical protein
LWASENTSHLAFVHIVEESVDVPLSDVVTKEPENEDGNNTEESSDEEFEFEDE